MAITRKLYEKGQKSIELFEQNENAPLIIYHAFAGEGEELNAKLQESTTRPYQLAVINGVKWNDEMTPWQIPPITKRDRGCGGRADEYLKQLQEEMLPELLAYLNGKVTYLAIAGYSLGGLFALYAGYQTELFERIASASGSFWYPNWKAYVAEHTLNKKVCKVYLSLGDQEYKTRNPYLQPVAEHTEWIYRWLKAQGMDTTFEWNRGNHYADATGRMARAILSLIKN